MELPEFWIDVMGKHLYRQWVNNALSPEAIAKMRGIRDCLVTIYYYLVVAKKIERIEDLEQEVKDQLKKDAQISASHLSAEEQVRFCKAIWAFANLI